MKAWKKNIMYCTYEMNEWATMRAFWFGFSQTGQIEEGGGIVFLWSLCADTIVARTT